ncbi:hypothetical protein ACLOJK_010775 [Asimina triloba]
MAHHAYHQSRSNPSILILTFVFLSAAAAAAAAASASEVPYHPHCDSIVPQPKPTAIVDSDPSSFLSLQSSYFYGGEALFSSQNANSTPFGFPKSISIRHSYIYRTETPGVFQLRSTLTFRGGGIYRFGNSTRASIGRKGYQVYPHGLRGHRGPGVFQRPGTVTFNLRGFWSETSGKLCMVGTGFGYSKEGKLLSLSAVFKLNCPKISNISTSLVTGTVESVDAADSFDYFDKISVLAYAQKSYEYTLVDRKESVCDGNDGGGEKSLGLEQDMGICSTLTRLGRGGFHLEYEGDCGKKNCSVFSGMIGLPSIMTIGGVGCSDKGKLQMFVQFPNRSSYSYRAAFDPERILVGEGVWDEEKKQACFVACRVLKAVGSFENTYVGDCSIGLTIIFPKTLSAKLRSFAVGHIWSNKNGNDTGYFDRIAFRSVENRVSGVTGLKYEYTEMGRLAKPCRKKKASKSGKRYPDGHLFDDMRFDFSLKDKRRRIGWGDSSPLTVGDRFYSYPHGSSVSQMTNDQVQVSNNSLLNVSYFNISYLIRLSLDGEWGGLSLNQLILDPIEVAAEGVYDAKTGTLCMVGCRHLSSAGKSLAENEEINDCAILINVEFAPFNPEAGGHLKGTIKSTRKKSDLLFFEPLELSSNVLYTSEAKGTIRRMDVEIVMILVSLMLACVFIGLQLFHVKKHPDVLPSMSLIMLVVLTLGHMIPLVLNFEAFLFSNRNRQNVLLWSGGWLEVNEVVVRVVTMVAFLLQFRLLQLVWSARLAEEGQKGLWVSEKKAMWLCLPLYIAGGLIALIVHWKMNEDTWPGPLYVANSQHHSIWEDLRSYAGLILDGFLLPQILLNIFCNSQDKALAPSFYIGTTIVRTLPHAYDAYRAHEYAPRFVPSYIYANPDADLYSPAWDIIIPCAGLLFAIIIYLQQRFGGAFMLPQRYRQSLQYDKVPVVSG